MLKVLETVIRLKCKCEYEWEYAGKNPYYACPYCKTQVNVRKHAIAQIHPKVGAHRGSVLPRTKGLGDPKPNG